MRPDRTGQHVVLLALLGTGMLSCSAYATDGTSSQQESMTQEKSLGNGVSAFAGVRVWANTWDMPVGDVSFVMPNPTAPAPLLQQAGTNKVSGTALSFIPLLGVRIGDISASVTHQAKTKYTADGFSNGVHRSESDIAVGYAIAPSISISAAYKYASIDRTATDRAALLNDGGSPNPAKIRALLLGISGSVPLSGDWGLYGNVAVGPTRMKLGSVGSDFQGDYRIAEFGFSRRINIAGSTSFLKGLSLTAGYRTQIVAFKDLEFRTYSFSAAGTPTEVSLQKAKQSSTTQGFVFGLLGVF